jgi:hypothetical protein
MYWCAHKTATLTSIQHTVRGGGAYAPPLDFDPPLLLIPPPIFSYFLPQNLNQLFIFVIGLASTCSRVDKNRAQFQKTNYFKKWS